MGKVKIVFFIDVLKENMDGVSNTMHQIIARLPSDKFEAIFVTPLPPENPDFPFPVYQCPYFELPFYKGYRFALPAKMKELENTLDAFSPDIVHWSTPSALGWYAVKYARKCRIPVVTIYHTHFTSYVEYYLWFIPGVYHISYPFEKMFLALYRKSTLVLAPTVSMKKYLDRIKVNARAIRLWGRGVDTSRFNPIHRAEDFFGRYGVQNQKIILFVSRLAKYKETDTLIRFYHLLGADFKLVITGDGPDKNRMERKMPGAIFTGKLTGVELSKAFASADVFVFTSITETFGNVILEAMASGLLVVAANAGGPADIIRHGETGFLTDPKNEHELHKKVVELLENKKLYHTIRENALNYAFRQNWDQLCGELFNHYSTLAKPSH